MDGNTARAGPGMAPPRGARRSTPLGYTIATSLIPCGAARGVIASPGGREAPPSGPGSEVLRGGRGRPFRRADCAPYSLNSSRGGITGGEFGSVIRRDMEGARGRELAEWMGEVWCAASPCAVPSLLESDEELADAKGDISYALGIE